MIFALIRALVVGVVVGIIVYVVLTLLTPVIALPVQTLAVLLGVCTAVIDFFGDGLRA